MRLIRGLPSILVAGAAALVLVAVAVAPFLTPAWVSFEQGRADAAAWTGLSADDLRMATDQILSDLVLGPPSFAVELNGVPVLSASERSHMRDVRVVFAGFYVTATVGLALLLIAWRLAGRGGSWSRAAFWRAVRAGAAGLGVGLLIAAVVAVTAFDAAFEVFHRLFFAAGTYTFDPRTDRLVQLFPEVFWSETAIAVGAVALTLAVLVVVMSGRVRAGGQADPGIAAATSR